MSSLPSVVGPGLLYALIANGRHILVTKQLKDGNFPQVSEWNEKAWTLPSLTWPNKPVRQVNRGFQCGTGG